MYIPISDERLATIKRLALSMAPEAQAYRAVMADLLAEVENLRDVLDWTVTAHQQFRLQLLDTFAGGAAAGDTLMIICRACRNVPKACSDSGCGGRRVAGWRGELPAGEAAAGQAFATPVILDTSTAAALDPALYVSLQAFKRAERALDQYGLSVPPVIVEMITVLTGLVAEATLATERPF